ncbi:UNVERIFIED_CONTAM: hypothetical protein Sradi_5752000 [Sesamum radiatum]|uniref:Uncharacterized protein n=1 Tax=Sesamum radiatum TaxID=300843 RepID=A0AAW2L4C1_SESRA
MHWALIYVLHGIQSKKFEELVTRAHDMELSITNHKPKFPVDFQKKESTKDENFSEPAATESMAIKATLVKFYPSERSEELRTNIHDVTKIDLLWMTKTRWVRTLPFNLVFSRLGALVTSIFESLGETTKNWHDETNKSKEIDESQSLHVSRP